MTSFRLLLAAKWLNDSDFLLALAEGDLTEMVRSTGLYGPICDFIKGLGGRDVELHFDPKSPSFVVEAKISDKPSTDFVKRFGKQLTDLLKFKITEEKWDTIRVA